MSVQAVISNGQWWVSRSYFVNFYVVKHTFFEKNFGVIKKVYKFASIYANKNHIKIIIIN